MADYSVDGPPVQNPRFHCYKKFLDIVDDERNMRLDTLCAEIAPAHAGDRMLQIDIEGEEYRVLMDASAEVMRSFRILLVEFHRLDHMFSARSLQFIRATFLKILRTHHVVHILPNNASRPRVRDDVSIPPVMEFTTARTAPRPCLGLSCSFRIRWTGTTCPASHRLSCRGAGGRTGHALRKAVAKR